MIHARSSRFGLLPSITTAGLVVVCALATSACDPASARGSAGSANAEDSGPLSNVKVSAPTIDFELPEFELVDHEKRPFKKADLAGKVWVTDFIFTSCPSVCPGLTRKMSALVKELEGNDAVRFLTITVDPENDTPEKLAAFGREHGTPSPKWFMVTGEPKVVDNTVIKGFLMAVQRGSARTDISHAERFVVVDKRAHVRGLFDTDDAGLASLKKRIDELAAE
ncbi:MAG: SCO family protein [Polyangiaceae bacterium]|nr:SCO family protein [Polyangiaceae bacterium]